MSGCVWNRWGESAFRDRRGVLAYTHTHAYTTRSAAERLHKEWTKKRGVKKTATREVEGFLEGFCGP